MAVLVRQFILQTCYMYHVSSLFCHHNRVMNIVYILENWY